MDFSLLGPHWVSKEGWEILSDGGDAHSHWEAVTSTLCTEPGKSTAPGQLSMPFLAGDTTDRGTCTEERGWHRMEGLESASCEGEGNDLAICAPGVRSLGGHGCGLELLTR